MKKLVAALAATAAFYAAPASAAVLAVDGGWTNFYFDETGTPIYDATSGDLSYTFELTGSATLKITDAYIVGDVFEFFLNGVSLGATSAPGSGPATSDPDVAYASGYYSRGTYALGAGSYTLTGIVTNSPVDSGAGFLELESGAAVPEPASWGMLIAGFGLIGSALRRRQPKVSYAV